MTNEVIVTVSEQNPCFVVAKSSFEAYRGVPSTPIAPTIFVVHAAYTYSALRSKFR